MRITTVATVLQINGFSSGWGGYRFELDPRATPEKREKNIQKAAARPFKNYPPKP
jgi:hypothetical protein